MLINGPLACVDDAGLSLCRVIKPLSGRVTAEEFEFKLLGEERRNKDVSQTPERARASLKSAVVAAESRRSGQR